MSTTQMNPNATGYSVVVEKDVFVRMRDGIDIAVDIYRPDAPGTFPTLYAVSPYQKDLAYLPAIPTFRFRETGDIRWWVEQGYVYVNADVRGSGKSTEGQWRLMSQSEQEDLYDTIEWIALQPWSNQKVGMIGESYYGWIQWMAAAQQPPHLVCIAPYDAMVDVYRDALYHGGIASMDFVTWWTWDTRARMLLDQPGPHDSNMMSYDVIYEMLRHPTDGEFWRERSAYPKFQQIKTPFYSIGNWKSVGLHLRGNLLAFEQIDAPKKLLVNAELPGYGGPAAAQRLFESPTVQEALLRWYDYWLKGIDNGVMDEPAVTLSIRHGEGYRQEREWPLARTEYRPLYLQQGPSGAVNSLNDGRLSWDPPEASEQVTEFHYPDPAWELGTSAIGKAGLANQVKKLLTFTSDPLHEDIEMTGPLVMKLWASSDQRDTDFFVKISDQVPAESMQVAQDLDVAPTAAMVTKGWLRASHRAIDAECSTAYRPFHTHQNPEPLQPGRIYQFEIEVWPTSWVFKQGHRIRLELANGDSRAFDAPFGHHYGLKMGTDTIYHDAEHPSHVLLPVIPKRACPGSCSIAGGSEQSA